MSSELEGKTQAAASEIRLPEVDMAQLQPGARVWVAGRIIRIEEGKTLSPLWVDFGGEPGGIAKTSKWMVVRILPDPTPPETDAQKIARL